MATETRKMPWTEAKQLAPPGAVAAVIAELERDESDSQTDYFATSTVRTVLIGWRMTSKESFANLRKCAARFPETAHMGPGRDKYSPRVVLQDDVVSNGSGYWKGSDSRWHSELDGNGYDAIAFGPLAQAQAFIAEKGDPEPIQFQTPDGPKLVRFAWDLRKESIEHRDNYSMGQGNYLKATTRYGSGWEVRSRNLAWKGYDGDTVEVAPSVSR